MRFSKETITRPTPVGHAPELQCVDRYDAHRTEGLTAEELCNGPKEEPKTADVPVKYFHGLEPTAKFEYTNTNTDAGVLTFEKFQEGARRMMNNGRYQVHPPAIDRRDHEWKPRPKVLIPMTHTEGGMMSPAEYASKYMGWHK